MPTIDTERYRLRNFVQGLVDCGACGACGVRDRPIDLVDVAAALDGNPRAVLFKAAGPERAFEFSVPRPPAAKKAAPHRSAAEALAAGPASFLELMAALGSKDGREIVRELDALYAARRLGRLDDGRYVLKDSHK